MSETPIYDLDWNTVETPCWVVDTRLLAANGKVFSRVRREAGVKILLALKGYACWSTFDILRPHMDGCCASGPIEARLGREEFGKEVETYAPAYTDRDLEETLAVSDHIVFNSFRQFHQHKGKVLASGRCDIGLRVNPEYSEVEVDLYNPCIVGSRLGIRRADFAGQDLSGVSGLHFHVMCEQGAEVLARVLPHFEQRFGDLLPQMRWVNFGGGHHITRKGYDVDALIALLKDFRARHPHLTVYLEPGEAVGWDTGVLVTSVLDTLHNGVDLAILDTSVSAHMPDVKEMPYRPGVHGGGDPGEKAHTYRLGGMTCLAGDVIGDWSFDKPLAIGDRVVFADQAHYTMVKTTTFNGVRHPAIALWDGKELRYVRRFDYHDYKNRLS